MEEGSPSGVVGSSWESDAERLLLLRSRAENLLLVGDEGGEEADLLSLPVLADVVLGGASLNMWIVSVAEETQRRVEVALKLME